MKVRKQFQFVARVIPALLIASISALWLVPPASAQGTAVISGTVDRHHISPGDVLHLGYEVAITDTDPTPTTVSVTNTIMQLSVSCPNGASQTITINAPTQSFLVRANTTSWFPSADTYEGQARAPSTLCGGKGGTESAVTFTTKYAYSCKSNSNGGCCHNVCFQMHHKHNQENPCSFVKSCHPSKQCTSPEKGGCCTNE
jgi:hypothetical protein